MRARQELKLARFFHLKLDDIPAHDFFVLNGDDAAARSLMLKLAGRCRSGALIPVTAEEFVAMKEQMLRFRIYASTIG